MEDLKYFEELIEKYKIVQLKIKEQKILTENDYYILFIHTLLTDEAK